MRKLVQINISANWGSTGKIVEQIGLCAMARGWESYIVYGNSMRPSKSELIKVGPKANKYIHYIEQRIFDNEGLCSRFLTRRVIKKIDAIKPDIINLHNIHDHYLNYHILFEYLNQTDIKVVWTFHDCWAFTGHCMHFVTKNCDRWKTGCHSCLMRGEYPKSLMDRSSRNWALKKSLFTANKNLTIVACSQWIADYVKDSFLGNRRIETMHNGVDLNTFDVVPVEKPKKFRILGVSSVWPKAKGIFDIFKLREMLPASQYEIMMVGLNSKQVESLPEGIIGIERTQNVQELVKLYNEADVLINPTYADTFPTVNLEALACGTPVITYRTGGSPEAIDEKTGVVVEQGDVKALAETIVKMREYPLKSEDCRQRALENFDKDISYEKYINLYQELLHE